jgi:hypothetical protein
MSLICSLNLVIKIGAELVQISYSYFYTQSLNERNMQDIDYLREFYNL